MLNMFENNAMNIFFHLSVHLLTSLIAGYLVWKKYRKYLSAGWRMATVFLAALIGGVLIDLDHFLDYFLAFGGNFNLEYFAQGYQFLKSDKIYILLHGWEYVIIILILALISKKSIKIKTILLALGISMLFHLSADLILNSGAKISTYSITYRIKSSFALKPLVTPEHYIDHQTRKKILQDL